MLFDLAMAAAPVTASLGHQRQHRIAEDLQYRVQTQMVGRLLRGADESCERDLLYVGRRGRMELAPMCVWEPGPEEQTRLTVRYLQLFSLCQPPLLSALQEVTKWNCLRGQVQQSL